MKKKLDETAKRKSEFYNKKREYSANIGSLIEKIKSGHAEHHRLVSAIKDSIAKKELLYKELDSSKAPLRELNESINKIREKEDIILNPAEIQKKIAELEYKIQTEVISFEKETGINKHIKKLKSALQKSKELSAMSEKKKTLIDSIKELRKSINSLKEIIYANRKSLRLLKENNISLSSEIDKLRAEREIINNKLIEINAQFLGISNQLKENLLALSLLTSKLQGITELEKSKRLAYEEKITKEKQEQVKEKLKRREKLTNEDLLAFQGKF